ncbi:probable ATP-dependent RNA helicase DDX42 [Coccomyxa sp. Obi]|nr:probable ATP-dependent RNA helicase DDX42 [Coccomyxa sp. Obi]
MNGQKRQFPYHSVVPEVEVKRQNLSDTVPGFERTQPAVFEAPTGYGDQEGQVPRPTDFTTWTETQVKSFLEQRGEDFDDSISFGDLILRAQECEYTTGPARKPEEQHQEAEADEDDPLDLYMKGIDQEVKDDKSSGRKTKPGIELDEEDAVADFLEARQQTAAAAAAADAMAGASGYGSDEEVYATARAVDDAEDAHIDARGPNDRKKIEPLAPLDHASIEYEDFAKDFYEEHPTMSAMTHAEVTALRASLGIRVSGFDAPKPVQTFEQCGLDGALMGVIKKAGYQKPTPIQAQAIPAALAGRDILGIAKTGSGKTAAFVLPMLVHIMDQPELEKGEGPIGIIVAPTRELSEQIHKETRRFSKPYNLRICAAFGGLSKYDQFKDLKAGAEVAVCTPGRMIDLIKMKACTCKRVTYLVFDEADRMFDMGFEPQVRSIIGQVRPDRQTLLFSATLPNKIDRLVQDALTSPVRVTVGEIGAANDDIRQVAEVLDDSGKLSWLKANLQGFIDQGDVLVFVSTKARAEEICGNLQAEGVKAAAIHGDMDQHSRMQVLHEYKAGKHHVLVATDVAARGLDIKSIKTVVNMDAAKDIDTHVHRVGRTGRAGDKDGVAYTLVTLREARFAGQLVNSLAAANQQVPQALMDLAAKDGRFRKAGGRKSGGRGIGGRGRGRPQVGGAGLGFGAGSAAPAVGEVPGSAAQLMKEPASHRTAAAMEAGFAKGGLESTVEGTNVAVPIAAASATLSVATGQDAGSAEQASQTVPQRQGGVWGGGGFKSMHTQQFRNSFVTSGITGGDIGQKPTIVAPRVAPTQPVALPPPPVPAAPVHNAASNASVQAAIAAAQAIAARLSGGPSQPAAAAPISYAPQSANTASIAAAQAIAARLSGGPSQPAAAAPNSYAQQSATPPSTQYAGNQWGGVSSGRPTSNSTQPFSYDKLNESALAGRRGYNSNAPPQQSSMPQQRWGGQGSHASAPAPRSYGQSSHASAPAPRSFGGRDSGYSRGGGAQPGATQAGGSASHWAAAIAAMDGDGQGSSRDDDRHRSSGSRDHDRRRESDGADRHSSHGSSRDGARPEKQSDGSRRRKWDMP